MTYEVCSWQQAEEELFIRAKKLMDNDIFLVMVNDTVLLLLLLQ